MATPSAEVASAALYGGGSDSRAAGAVTVESTAGVYCCGGQTHAEPGEKANPPSLVRKTTF